MITYKHAHVVKVDATETDLNNIDHTQYTPDLTFRENVLEALGEGGKILDLYVVYRVGWEMDNFIAIAKDGHKICVFHESHGYLKSEPLSHPEYINMDEEMVSRYA
jgi:hypothetical protein